MGRILEKVFAAKFKILSRHFPEAIEEYHENFGLRQLIVPHYGPLVLINYTQQFAVLRVSFPKQTNLAP